MTLCACKDFKACTTFARCTRWIKEDWLISFRGGGVWAIHLWMESSQWVPVGPWGSHTWREAKQREEGCGSMSLASAWSMGVSESQCPLGLQARTHSSAPVNHWHRAGRGAGKIDPSSSFWTKPSHPHRMQIWACKSSASPVLKTSERHPPS